MLVVDLTKLSIYRSQRASMYHTVDTTTIYRYITVYRKEFFHDLEINLQEIKNYAGKSENLLAA